MINLISPLLAILSPIPIITVFLAGLIVGFIYVRRIVDFNRAFGYHNSVIAGAFFICLAAVQLFEGIVGWELWLAGFILYAIYMVGIWIGKNRD